MRVITIAVCVGSSCYLRGAPEVIRQFQQLLAQRGDSDVVLKGSFCMEQCTNGVSVRIDDRIFVGVHPEDVPRLYAEQILPRLTGGSPDDATRTGEERKP